MLDIRVSAVTSASPDDVLRAARDFSEERPRIWRNCKLPFLRVHDQGDDFAEVTEGLRIGGVFWERSRYEWSQPCSVRQVVLESNVLAPGSTWELDAEPRDGGGSTVEMRLRRDFHSSPKGRVGFTLNHLGGRRGWGAYLRRALAEIEKRAS